MLDEAPTRPVLRYHGGKFRMAPWIIGQLPKHGVYVEPFGGAASVLMLKPRVAAECYNDLDSNVVNLFRILREPYQAAELQRRVALTPYARDELDRAHEDPVDDMDAAHKLIVRAFLGRGSDAATRQGTSGFSTLLSEERALPAFAFAAWPDAIPSFTDRLRGVVIENRPAIEIIQRFDTPNTLTYVDPPYMHSTRTSLEGRSKKTHGYKHEMTDADHIALAEVLHQVKGMVALSSYPSDLYAQLYAGWTCTTNKAIADGGKVRQEMLWLNPACSHAMGNQRAQRNLFKEVPSGWRMD